MQVIPLEFADAYNVTPSNTDDLPKAGVTGLYIGNTGDVTLDTPTTTGVLFKAVPAGTVLHLPVKRVRATGTTSNNITALIGR